MAYLEPARAGSTGEPGPDRRRLKVRPSATSAAIRALQAWVTLPVVAGGVVLWEVAAAQLWLSSLFFPPPTRILATFVSMVRTGAFWESLGLTVYRLTLGVALGAGAGVLLGWLMGASRAVRIALDPVVAALHPMPKLALFPLFLVVLGIGESSRIALVALAALFPALINTCAEVRQIDRTLWEAAASYGAAGLVLVRRVVVPGSLPMLMAGFRLSVNGAFVVLIAVEMLSARDGLGAGIWMAWQTMRTEQLYATLLVIGLLGVVFNAVLYRLERMLVPWQVQHVNSGGA